MPARPYCKDRLKTKGAGKRRVKAMGSCLLGAGNRGKAARHFSAWIAFWILYCDDYYDEMLITLVELHKNWILTFKLGGLLENKKCKIQFGQKFSISNLTSIYPNPHFIWKPSFVTSHTYCPALTGGRVSALHYYSKPAGRKWQTIVVR